MIKKVISLMIAAAVGFSSLNIADKILSAKVNELYYPAFGDSLDVHKIQGIILQKTAIEQSNSIPLYGSSELTNIENPYHPLHFLSENRGIQVNLIGRGYCQSLIQIMDYGALGDTLNGKKVALILSPQWFSKTGLAIDNFNMNFSEQQYLAFMLNDKISPSLKHYVAQRVGRMIERRADTTEVKVFNYLYNRDTLASRFVFGIMEPFYRLKLQLLSLKDKVTAYQILSKRTKIKAHIVTAEQSSKSTDWDAAKKAAEKMGMERANNNEFYMDNKYYDRFVRDKVSGLQGHLKDQSFLNSPEYQDFAKLLELCREQGIKPLFISIPVNGRWYDYSGFDKSNREQYYENIRQMVSSYGFSLADFSGHEYDRYFLQDGMHVGWKGWIYVNEALSSYFSQ
ncbi:MAG: D-alanyl-lipoteichoic acid biosynthesis protein DltD [Peptococcaceae bacterium]|nr:D-alanyl-lipoteichoic acid biosynthesis protein DltD [Peptococcaceae bacterium]